MKNRTLILLNILSLCICINIQHVHASGGWVSGYYRADGTYVNGYSNGSPEEQTSAEYNSASSNVSYDSKSDASANNQFTELPKVKDDNYYGGGSYSQELLNDSVKLQENILKAQDATNLIGELKSEESLESYPQCIYPTAIGCTTQEQVTDTRLSALARGSPNDGTFQMCQSQADQYQADLTSYNTCIQNAESDVETKINAQEAQITQLQTENQTYQDQITTLQKQVNSTPSSTPQDQPDEENNVDTVTYIPVLIEPDNSNSNPPSQDNNSLVENPGKVAGAFSPISPTSPVKDSLNLSSFSSLTSNPSTSPATSSSVLATSSSKSIPVSGKNLFQKIYDFFTHLF